MDGGATCEEARVSSHFTGWSCQMQLSNMRAGTERWNQLEMRRARLPIGSRSRLVHVLPTREISGSARCNPRLPATLDPVAFCSLLPFRSTQSSNIHASRVEAQRYLSPGIFATCQCYGALSDKRPSLARGHVKCVASLMHDRSARMTSPSSVRRTIVTPHLS